ncbi:hypothetical protein J7K74_03350 [Candidatus Woesearchaeota archaeon]|nr:hypothetical protein [Candidatus Woesearchaeota archaeon]
MAGFVIIPALLIGIIISLVEIFFVHQDEAGMGWFKHAIHTLPFMFLFIFVSMNLDWALGLIGITNNPIYTIVARVLIGIIAFVKIKAAAAIVGGRSFGEKTIHVLIVALLVVIAPYIWDYLLAGIAKKYLP